MVAGVFFDLGGTLFGYGKMQATNAALLARLAERLDLPSESVRRAYREATRTVDQQKADQPFYLFRDYFELIFDDFIARIGRPDLRSAFDWFGPEQRDGLVACLEIRPDCHTTLGALQRRGLYLSAVSNIDEDMIQPLIAREGLHRWLTHWTSSEAARSCKPDRRFFELALEKAGLEPDQVLFVGDSLEQDILGAHAVGMRTVLIEDHDQPAPMHIGRPTPEPTYRITRLGALLDIVADLTA